MIYIMSKILWLIIMPLNIIILLLLLGWILLVSGISLVGALAHYRFWCRYFCPLGALLALGNKLALLRRVSPQRRFERCDLGVGSEFDVDCIHCHRCITAVDTRLRRRAGPGEEPGPEDEPLLPEKSG